MRVPVAVCMPTVCVSLLWQQASTNLFMQLWLWLGDTVTSTFGGWSQPSQAIMSLTVVPVTS
jgi:hypothetical protein